MEIHLLKYRSTICLKGEIPNADFFQKLSASPSRLQIIAADGAANNLHAIGIKPDIIIGDLDSVEPELLLTTPYTKISNQNLSDFQKALDYVDERNLSPSIICGISGGYIDHILNNISIFIQSNESLFIDHTITGFALRRGTHEFEFPKHTKVSIFGTPKCTINSKGLKWELAECELSFPGQSSSFNRTTSHKLILTISKGSALLITYRKPVIDAGIS